jgi:hypothetical protein
VGIGSGAITSGLIASGQIGSFHLSSGSVTSGKIASGQVGSFHLSSGAIVSGRIASGQVGLYHLASGVLWATSGSAGGATSGNEFVRWKTVDFPYQSGDSGTTETRTTLVMLASGELVTGAGYHVRDEFQTSGFSALPNLDLGISGVSETRFITNQLLSVSGASEFYTNVTPYVNFNASVPLTVRLTAGADIWLVSGKVRIWYESTILPPTPQ